MLRSEFINTVSKIVNESRVSEYGKPEDSFANIASFWSTYLDTDISREDVAVMMALLKIARIKANIKHTDSWVDLAGYAVCGGLNQNNKRAC